MAKENPKRPEPRDDRQDKPDRSRDVYGAAGRDPAAPESDKTAPRGSETIRHDAAMEADNQKSIDELASLQDELEKAKDHALRCRAEMENFKKRLSRQFEEERQYANVPIMQDLLPVLDNMDRAIEAATNSENAAGLLEGFSMVAGQLRSVLAKYDCLEIDALHKSFDPNCHEAVSQMANGEYPAHTVVAVVQPGFQIHDRVIRPSKVIVSTEPNPQDEE